LTYRRERPPIDDRELHYKLLEIDLLHLFRFKQFFSGLIFAIISFMASHQISTKNVPIKLIEISSMSLLFVSGLILLIQLAGYRVHYENLECKCIISVYKLIFKRGIIYWICFLLGVLLMIVNRSLLLFGF